MSHQSDDRKEQQHPEGNVPQRRDIHDPRQGMPIDDGIPAELENDKMIGEDVLREDSEADSSNVNDDPGFDDGRLGGSDGDVRQSDPSAGDAGGEVEGGIGRRHSGGIDGGPPRK